MSNNDERVEHAGSTASRNSLWIWVGLAFGLMLAAWMTFFIVASHHKVEEVPLQSAPGTTR